MESIALGHSRVQLPRGSASLPSGAGRTSFAISGRHGTHTEGRGNPSAETCTVETYKACVAGAKMMTKREESSLGKLWKKD